MSWLQAGDFARDGIHAGPDCQTKVRWQKSIDSCQRTIVFRERAWFCRFKMNSQAFWKVQVVRQIPALL
jgi:hypothetical protein